MLAVLLLGIIPERTFFNSGEWPMTTTRSAFGAVVFIFLCAMAWIGGDGARATPSSAGWPQRASDHAGHILLAGDNTFSRTGSAANRASGTDVVAPPNFRRRSIEDMSRPTHSEGAAAPRSINSMRFQMAPSRPDWG